MCTEKGRGRLPPSVERGVQAHVSMEEKGWAAGGGGGRLLAKLAALQTPEKKSADFQGSVGGGGISLFPAL